MLRNYQTEIAVRTEKILRDYKIAILSIEMRVGKTLIALKAAELLGMKNVLFVTKKKAIESIRQDYERSSGTIDEFTFKLTVINYEQLPKIFEFRHDYDLIVGDESHSFGAFPKPSLRTQHLKDIVGDNYLILLSGTLTPESYSQIYHQLYISKNSPFSEYKNFYKWAKEFVDVKKKLINGLSINDYSRANYQKIMDKVAHLIISYTRAEAGFEQAEVEEELIFLSNENVKRMADYIIEKKVVQLPGGGTILCDTAAKLQGKVHQIYSGTVITEEGGMLILDKSKANYIAANYRNMRIAIYYKYKAEGKVLKQIFEDELTESPEVFNQGVKRIFISQIQSGSMGINLSTADVLIFYNIDFSAVLYWQARARLQTFDRLKPAIVHWIFIENGIEEKIYKTVMKKKKYTTSYFTRDYLNGNKEIRIGHSV